MITEDQFADFKKTLIIHYVQNSVVYLNPITKLDFADFVLNNPGYFGDLITMYDEDSNLNKDEILVKFGSGNSFYYTLGENIPATAKQIEYGSTCIKCQEIYPYAIKIDNFKCWGCKNF